MKDKMKPWKEKLEDFFKNRFGADKKADDWANRQNERFKNWAGDSYDKDYKFGKEWKWNSFDFFNKNL